MGRFNRLVKIAVEMPWPIAVALIIAALVVAGFLSGDQLITLFRTIFGGE